MRSRLSLLAAVTQFVGLPGVGAFLPSSLRLKEPTPANRRHWNARELHRSLWGNNPQAVATRQRRRAELRARWYATYGPRLDPRLDFTRKERRQLARARAAGEWKLQQLPSAA